MVGTTKPAWADGGVCLPKCLPPQIWVPSTPGSGVAGHCICEDNTPINNLGFCCPGNDEILDNSTNICSCDHDNMERVCRSRNPDEDCNDECQCIEGWSKNNWGHCCDHEAYPSLISTDVDGN